MSSSADDEALARALQEQYQRDYEASMRSSQPSPTAPPEDSAPPRPPPANTESDEQMARRLQREMEEEARRLSASASARPNPSSYTAGTPVAQPVLATVVSVSPATATASSPLRGSTGRPSSSRRSRANPVVYSHRREPTGRSHDSSSSRPATEGSRSSGAQPSSSRRPPPHHTNPSGRAVGPAAQPAYPPLSPMVASTTMEQQQYPDSAPDVELAMRIQQEEHDAALAAQMARQDQESASRRVTRREERRAGRNRPWTVRRVAALVCPAVVIIAVVAVVVLVVAGRGDLGNIADIFDDDPFNPGETSKWKNDGNGLKLEVVNALQDHWQGSFEVAMADWDNGDPDALSLSTSVADYDYECEPIRGKMKVCNGDYGDTRWKGINQVLISNGWIISSVAKLNEFYLSSGSSDQKQYTMCHELGHGFGLPHTDENFYNADLGNCMDYTNNPRANMQPDRGNYEFLTELYGEVPGRMLDSSSEHDGPGKADGTPYKWGEDGSLPPELLQLYHDAVKLLEFGDTQEEWAVLHNNENGELRSIDLGNNYTLVVSMLLATH